MENIKKEAIIIALLVILIIAVCFSFVYKKYSNYEKIYAAAQNPFSTLEIMGKKVKLSSVVREYEITANCSELEEGADVVYYNLEGGYKNDEVTIETIALNVNNTIVEDNRKAAKIDIIIKDNSKKTEFEQLFRIKVTCDNPYVETTSVVNTPKKRR